MTKKRTSVKKNIIANFSGALSQVLVSVIFMPIYIKFLGAEGFGVLGVLFTLQGLLAVFDMGLSVTLNRELARVSALDEDADVLRDFIHTLEFIYILIGICVGLIVIGTAPLIAYYGVKAEQLSEAVIMQSIMIFGLGITFRWPQGLYGGGMLGQQRHVSMNVLNIVAILIQQIGAVLILVYIAPSIRLFLLWQFVMGGIHTVLLKFLFWHGVPHGSRRPRFKWSSLKPHWRFSSGITGISLTSLILTQADKILLATLLPLNSFGYYSFASRLSIQIHQLVGVFSQTLFPRFSQLVALGETQRIKELYHRVCQINVLATLPFSIPLAIFAKPILLFWLKDTEAANQMHLILTLLIIGQALNSLVLFPHILQLAYGWTSLAWKKNVVAIIFLIPLTILMVQWFGPTGAALVWILLNAGYVVLEIPIMHRRLLKTEMWRWYRLDFGLPMAICAVVWFLAYWIVPPKASNIQMLGAAGGVGILLIILFYFTLSSIPKVNLKQIFAFNGMPF